ncbi:MAG: hypothetical protein KTR31_15275 [Myxococcales bacterium]|nr:hypothetical protein [Myxococcales bacterium]
MARKLIWSVLLWGGCTSSAPSPSPPMEHLPSDDAPDERDCSSLDVLPGDATLSGGSAHDLAEALCDEWNAVGGTLTLRNTPFEDLEPLSCLCQLGGLVLSDNPRLVDATALTHATLVAPDSSELEPAVLRVESNDRLQRLAVPRVTAEAAVVVFSYNGALDRVTGLHDLREIEVLQLRGRNRLVPLSTFRGVERIGTLDISGGAIPSLTGLQAVEDVARINIVGVEGLPDLAGLERVTTSELTIRQNSDLASLRGLDSLRAAADIQITDNPSLSDVSDLHSLKEVTDRLTLVNNAVSAEDLEALVAAIGEENIGWIEVSP